MKISPTEQAHRHEMDGLMDAVKIISKAYRDKAENYVLDLMVKLGVKTLDVMDFDLVNGPCVYGTKTLESVSIKKGRIEIQYGDEDGSYRMFLTSLPVGTIEDVVDCIEQMVEDSENN